MHIFGLSEEARVPVKACKLHIERHQLASGFNPGPSCCEATLLTTAPLCDNYDNCYIIVVHVIISTSIQTDKLVPITRHFLIQEVAVGGYINN